MSGIKKNTWNDNLELVLVPQEGKKMRGRLEKKLEYIRKDDLSLSSIKESWNVEGNLEGRRSILRGRLSGILLQIEGVTWMVLKVT